MNFYGFTVEKLRQFFIEQDENPAKAEILFDGIYRKGYKSFEEFQFSERVLKKLSVFTLDKPEVVKKLDSADAAKLLLRLEDGNYCETVLMRQRFGNCVCVSTQVGCNMGCKFCKSGMLKKRRDLTAGEMTAQVLALASEFSCEISGVSVMGIGEPFDNFEAVSDFCGIITEDKGLAVSRRRVTVSTCGIVPKIREFAERAPSVSLAISLHAPNDGLRSELMPINKVYPISEVLDAAAYYSEKTGKRVTLEYILLSGINDGEVHAKELAELIRGRNLYVNLIPYNETDTDFKKPSPEAVDNFCRVLKENGVIATKRREFGAELKAACGQLMADYND
ncbi:MAG: 23S rRNA (adenine(2503)-C(2))-methyltransferase RlmN [Oscillospiraceae bacterium]|nr:23S rRNA (adenine(2503)-C(2))-methyltransferase RlmN [Oscillospiraceae bacterium]